MSHLIRAGLALALAIGLFLGFRSLVLQGHLSLAQFALGPPMRESSVGRWAGKPLQFSGSEGCAGSNCHQDTYDVWASSAHGGVSCETCHDAAKDHADNTDIAVPTDVAPQVCTLCHASAMGRPAKFPQVDVVDHFSETTCTSCHAAHRPGPARAISHEVSAGSDCLSCHSPSGPPDRAVPADHSGRTNQQCLSCHETKR